MRRLGGLPRVFAECVLGGSLKDWIDDRRLYHGGPEEALKRILDIAIQFAWGLHYAHEQGLVHQDVKPANVMMTPIGIAKVSDFGLAKARAAAGEGSTGERQQSIQVSFGGMTPAYCSPEQANSERLSRKTDIWSWGLSVLEMFTGDVTWMSGVAAGEAIEEYLEVGADDERIPPMPQPVVELLRRCFQHDPAARPKSLHDLAEVLREAYVEASCGQPYPLQQPKASALSADFLNNRAVSLLDLGRKAEAIKLFDEVLRLQPGHPEATHNKLLCRGFARSAYSPGQHLLLCQPRVDVVRLEVGNQNINLVDPTAIVKLGEVGLAAAIRLFREPRHHRHGDLNQAALACALVEFAKRGDARARDFLFDIAQGQVPLFVGPDGDAALEIAQSYVYGF